MTGRDTSSLIIELEARIVSMCVAISSEQSQFFASNFAKIMHVINSGLLSPSQADAVLSVRRLARQIRRGKPLAVSEELVTVAGEVVDLLSRRASEIVRTVDEPEVEELVRLERPALVEVESRRWLYFTGNVEQVLATETIRSERGEGAIAVVDCGDAGRLRFLLLPPWSELSNALRAGYRLIVHNPSPADAGKSYDYTSSDQTIVVLEPDYLVDVTSIAECFAGKHPNYLLHFLRRYQPGHPNPRMFFGSLVNSFFDQLIKDPERELEHAFRIACLEKPLAAISYLSNQELIDEMSARTEVAFENLRQEVTALPDYQLSVEPTFLSWIYGLQGRLDLLLEDPNRPTWKTVVELKTGEKSPSLGAVRILDGIAVPTAVWANHLAQVNGYNLLLDSTYRERVGDSIILYAEAGVARMRNVPNAIQVKKEFMVIRNRIVVMELELQRGSDLVFRRLAAADPSSLPSFAIPDLKIFQDAYTAMTQTDRAYYCAFSMFIARELMLAKCGEHSSERHSAGFARLWNGTTQEKLEAFSLMTGLRPQRRALDEGSEHLIFTRANASLVPLVFRQGDLVVLYPVDADGNPILSNRPLMKGAIRRLTNELVEIAIRNRYEHDLYFHEECEWALEPDSSDTTLTSLQTSLNSFLLAERRTRDLILGTVEPRFTNEHFILSDGLTDEQRSIANRALRAQDYFLMQGPPGTGKTSRMIRAIVEFLFSQSTEQILLVAFTNRAVDELCQMLERIDVKPHYVRLGGTGSEYASRSPAQLVRQAGALGFAQEFHDSRIVCSTTASLVANPELFHLKSFDTIVLDEASQILEPTISFLFAHGARVILVGDEKQLPAVVQQDASSTQVTDPHLREIDLIDLRNSWFGRMVGVCERNGWNSAYSMLTRQGRMHALIQQFPSTTFYESALQTASAWQEDIDMPSAERLMLVELEWSNENVHPDEAPAIVAIVEQCISHGVSTENIGVVCPFRVQIGAISALLRQGGIEGVTVDSVERYQGSERDIIVCGFGLTSSARVRRAMSLAMVGGRQVDRKLNVALTRARERLIVVAQHESFREAPMYSDLFSFIRTHGTVLRWHNGRFA